jgi:hypothetical protein
MPLQDFLLQGLFSMTKKTDEFALAEFADELVVPDKFF